MASCHNKKLSGMCMGCMNKIRKALMLALISIPISWLGIDASFALAHGSILVLIPFVLPGYVAALKLVGENGSPIAFEVVFYVSQYISYAVVIYIGMVLKNRFWKTDAKT